MQIKEMHENERPREKALFSGVESLNNVELLALMIKTGTKNVSSLDLANQILVTCQGFSRLTQLDLATLMQIKGIKQAKAIDILACIELARRLQFSYEDEGREIHHSRDAYLYLCNKMQDLQQECFVALFLNTKNMIISEKMIYKGGLDASIVHPREIFKEAMHRSASKIIVCHNHPSGNPTPSIADVEVTKMIRETGEIVGIPLLDHIIIGKGKYVSLREADLF